MRSVKYLASKAVTSRRPNRDRQKSAGMTTVELLVVLAIIGVIASISIPVMARMGLFGGQRAELAGRELFTMIRAAREYATTHNVNAGIVYSPLLVRDSATNEIVPIVDAYAIVRQVRREDLELPEFATLVGTGTPANTNYANRIYVPIGSAEGSFKTFENNACILPGIFEVQTIFSSVSSVTGLSDIVIWDTADSAFYSARSVNSIPGDSSSALISLDYDIKGANLPNSFPAHVFKSSGALNVETARQRITVRAGMFPDGDPGDRFVDATALQDSAFAPTTTVAINRNHAPHPRPYTVFFTGPNPVDDELEIDLEIYIYAAQGRLKAEEL